MEEALHAIVEARRRDILELVLDHELTAGDIAAHFQGEVTRPAISQHLKVLRESGLITERREGVRRYYKARPEGFAELRAYLEWMWDVGLNRLKQAAEAEARGRKIEPGPGGPDING